MYRRLITLSLIIFVSLGALTLLGYHALSKWAQGLAGARLGEYAKIAEQVRQDINERLDSFLQKEQDRPYTDYLFYHVPEQDQAQAQAPVLLRSPLGGSLAHDLAYGHFQVEADGTISTPNDDILQREGINTFNGAVDQAVSQLRSDISGHLLPILGLDRPAGVKPNRVPPSEPQERDQVALAYQESLSNTKLQLAQRSRAKQQLADSQALQIDSLQNQSQAARFLRQNRATILDNFASNTIVTPQKGVDVGSIDASGQAVTSAAPAGALQAPTPNTPWLAPGEGLFEPAQIEPAQEQASSPPVAVYQTPEALRQVLKDIDAQMAANGTADTIQIRIEPLVPVPASTQGETPSIFGGKVFMLRHVQIEDRHVLQGFQLNEEKLIEEVRASAQIVVQAHPGIELELSGQHREDRAFASVLDFGFGDLVLNLIETNPGWISQRVLWLRKWYLGTIAVVLITVILGLTGLGRGIAQQAQLSRQKDDFISAVSHELRTPLTSIRMYAEMLEKGWVKTNDKRQHYYQNVRQESERLSRLIENVLDFARIQRGKKQYSFELGNINDCVNRTIDMIRPHATQQGFSIHTDLGELPALAFDRDAVTQIVINLLDNAIKYARKSPDKTIHVRTAQQDAYCLIEVQDHGPGVALHQRKKIFDPFYRVEAESTRQSTGTGLGLALVKRLAEAHQGYVQIASAPSSGAVFKVCLACHLES